LFHSWLTSESAQPKDYFGVAVACTETRLVVGAYGTDGPGTLTDRGGAEVYALQGQRWLREATLVAPVSESSDYQGLAVSINGDTIVVGSAYHQPEVFIRSGGVWVHQQTLTALSSAEGVSVQGNTVMVLGYTDPDLAQGPVVYVRTAGVWSEQARLQPSDWTTNWAYKRDVALWGDLAIVSVPSTYDYPAHIWFFRRNGTTWIEQQRIDGTGSDFGYRICLRGDLALFSAHDRPRLLKYNGSQWLELPNPIPAAEQPALGYHGSVAISASRAIIGAGDDHPAWVLHWNGTAWDYETSFDLPDSVTANHAGFSAAVSGSLAILGAPGQVGAGGGDVGAAYVFAREGNDWHYSATLASPAPDTRSRFGHSVALDGTTALIGAPLAQERSGSEIGAVHVYVSAAGVWSKQASLSEPAPAGGDRFGSAVALAGDLAVIGTPGRDQGAMGDAGGAAVFVRSGTAWDHAAALTGQAHAAGDAFGSSVATDGTSIAVGSPLDDTAQGGDAGSACVFVKSGKAWVLQAQLFASDAAAGDRFGNAVAIDGTTALTGAPGADIAANADAGAAYAFTRPFAAWSQQAKLLASQPAAQDAFGSAVALVGDRALVGAPGRDPSSQTDAGAAFAFSRRNAVWAAASTLAVPGALAGDRFGSAVALDAAVAVVGGPGRDSFHGPDAGAAQVYHLSGSAWTAAELLHAPDFFLELPDDYLRPTITLDLDRDTAVIGMPRGHTAPSGRTGTVYVFTQRAGVWLWDASLRPDDQVPVSEFGGCLGIAGSWLFASGSQNPGAGAVFLFRNSGGNWTQHSILKNPDRPDSGGFGQAVDIDGERCAISDSSHNTVHVFQLAGNAWTVLDSVDGPAELSTFGNSLALDGDSLLVGEDWVSSSDHNGSVFCYRFAAGMWRQEALLTLEEPPADARFGSAIAADGGTALISAPYLETSAGIRAGIVEAHVRQPDGTWARQARWTGTQERGEFGHVLALQGDTAVVGSSPKGTWGVWQGSPGIHIYSRGGTQWQHRAFLPAPVEATPSSLGDALALDGETLLASSTRADLELPQFGTLAVDNGAVFAYRLQFVEADVAVHDGPNVSSPEILCGQTSPITFELTLVSKDVERTFTIANTGEEDLHLTGMAVPAGFELLDALPAALAPGANAQFGIRALADSLGVFAGEVTITCDDPEENPFRFPIRSEVVTSAFLQYHQWATAAGLEGADYPPLASPAGDGITNLMKYASNVAPRDPGPDYLPPKPLPGDRGMPRITVVGSGPYSLRFEYLRRLGSDLSYEPLKSSWGTTPAWGPVGGVMTIHPHGTGWERVVIEEPCGTAPRMFGTVRVRLP
jgi:hypothetical protein